MIQWLKNKLTPKWAVYHIETGHIMGRYFSRSIAIAESQDLNWSKYQGLGLRDTVGDNWKRYSVATVQEVKEKYEGRSKVHAGSDSGHAE